MKRILAVSLLLILAACARHPEGLRTGDLLFFDYPEALYCSELVQECYRGPDGKSLFPSQPMNFKGSTSAYPANWVHLYEGLGEPIPHGEPGTNPQDLSESPLLEEIMMLC